MKEIKSLGILAYFTIIGTVIAMIMNTDAEKKSNFNSFHIRQALGVFLSFFLLGYFVSYADSWTATSAFYIFFFILWIYGFLAALEGKTKLIPVLGNFFQKIFKTL
jgi:uncharacterized membrane protein